MLGLGLQGHLHELHSGLRLAGYCIWAVKSCLEAGHSCCPCCFGDGRNDGTSDMCHVDCVNRRLQVCLAMAHAHNSCQLESACEAERALHATFSKDKC